MSARHLVRRFAWSVRPGPPDPAGEAWLVAMLAPAERELYDAMPDLDRRHAVRCAQRMRDAGRDVVLAAALHDVGKTPARLGTFGRVGATLLGVVPVAWGGRVGTYLDHPEVGATMLAEAGSADIVVAWAREHHLPPERWSVPADLGRRLVAADGE